MHFLKNPQSRVATGEYSVHRSAIAMNGSKLSNYCNIFSSCRPSKESIKSRGCRNVFFIVLLWVKMSCVARAFLRLQFRNLTSFNAVFLNLLGSKSRTTTNFWFTVPVPNKFRFLSQIFPPKCKEHVALAWISSIKCTLLILFSILVTLFNHTANFSWF